MSSQLIDHNQDLLKLREKGYNIDIHSAYLVVRDIPYVDNKRAVHTDGVLITELTLNGDKTIAPRRHQIWFVGTCPCDDKGSEINAIRPSAKQHRISDKFTANFEFSNKPSEGYADHFVKVRNYAALISGPAANLDKNASPLTKVVVEPEADESPFNYLDTASAGAGISMATQKLVVEKIAIVGLGGSGSYVLDQLAKTPVKEIHIFDGDKFSSHNAFRAPGAASVDELRSQATKVDYFKGIYSKMHRGIISHPVYVDSENVADLKDMSFVFICADAGPGKRLVVEALEQTEISFIDVGMGLYEKEEAIGGILQVVASTSLNRNQARSRMSLADTDEANEYDRNIQIADLNALNAQLAIVCWKKMRGFYHNQDRSGFLTYTVGRNQLLRDDPYDADS